MIKIKLNNKKAQKFADLVLTAHGKYETVDGKLDLWLINNPYNPQRGIIKYLKKNIRKILISKPTELEKIINDLKSKGYQDKIYNSKKSELTNLGKEIKKMFNYEGFRQSVKAVWLSQQLNIKSCTYCNSQYTLTVIHNKKTKLLFHLDHFFPKSIYPYLSLSYYNLIPCCASCNMSKSDKPYKLSENIHPYIDSLDKIAQYKAESGSLAKFLLNMNKNENKIKLQLIMRNNYAGNSKIDKKLENYKNEFKVETQYAQFNDVVAETYLKGIYYNKQRRIELEKFFKNKKGTILTEEMIHRFIVGNYTESKDLLKRPLAKMMKDISEDFNLI